MMSILERQTEQAIRESLWLTDALELEDLKLRPLFNRKCHWNCLAYANLDLKVKFIVATIQEFSGDLCAHFIVQFEDGTYADPTYGAVTSKTRNWLVHKIKVEDFKDPDEELLKLKKWLVNKYTPKGLIYKVMHKIKGDNLVWSII